MPASRPYRAAKEDNRPGCALKRAASDPHASPQQADVEFRRRSKTYIPTPVLAENVPEVPCMQSSEQEAIPQLCRPAEETPVERMN